MIAEAVARDIARAEAEMFDRPIETMPRDALASLQRERLRATVRNAWEDVPLMRERLDAAGVRAEDLRSTDDVRRLSFTRKRDLRRTPVTPA
jgi:phenylacetate-CoA ligase